MVSTKQKAKEPLRATPRTAPQPQPQPQPPLPSAPNTESLNGKKKKKKKGKGKATAEHEDAFADGDLDSPPLDFEADEDELEEDLKRHVADMASDLVESGAFVHNYTHSTTTTHSVNIQLPLQGDTLHRIPNTTASATEAAQAELLATANELYRRMDADPAGGLGIASDEEYWASLPAHIRNFAQAMYAIAQQMVQTGAAAAAAAANNASDPHAAAAEAMKAAGGNLPSGMAGLAGIGVGVGVGVGIGPPGGGGMPAGWPSSLQLPVDPSMFSDAAFHLAMEQVATGRFDEHGVPESVSVGEDDEEEVSSDGETFGVRASSMLNTTNATQAEGDRDGRSGAKNRKKKKKRAGVAEKIPTVSEERPATENGLEGSVRPLMAPARQNRQAHPPPAQTTQSQTPQTTTTTTNTPQAAHPPPPNVAAAAAAVATHPPSSRAAGKQPMNYAQQQQQQQQQPQPAPPPAARTAPAPPRQPSHHHNHGRHPSPPSSNASGHRPQPNAKSHGGTGGGTTNNKIWSTSSSEERERIKEFWLALGEQERRNLVKVEKEAVLKKMKEQQKHSCSCAVCGRKRNAIEEELEVLYDAYYEELEQYANYQQRYVSSGGTLPPPPGPGPFPGSVELDKNGAVVGHPQANANANAKSQQDRHRTNRAAKGQQPVQQQQPQQQQQVTPQQQQPAVMTNGRKVNGHHAQVNGKEESEFDEDEEAEDEYEDEGEYEEDEDEEDEEEDEDAEGDEEEDEDKAARRANGRAGRKAAEEKPNGRDSLFNFGNSLAVTGNILTVADDLLKNDGQKFLEMMEQLAERRMQREEEATQDVEDESDEDDEDEDGDGEDDESE
ncbi:uncharacterized protein STEHIDRAFT_123056, partial [Stereum hirsutum FP-91666 SS1]|uniref:uncharacterized protein n=1 Tax=Stereum hirsutum (strain FP-91666) TaxID=721885 RepID=UPI00044496F4